MTIFPGNKQHWRAFVRGAVTRVNPEDMMWMWRNRNSCLPAVLAVILGLVMADEAWADLKLCNKTGSTIGVALGYKDDKGWASEGWWNIPPRSCKTLLQGNLIARYYYIYAVDYDKGGEWSGPATMCTQDRIFTIRGRKNCEARGYKTRGFYEVDTGEKTDFTIVLRESGRRRQKNGK